MENNYCLNPDFRILMCGSVATDANLQAGAECKWQAGIADGAYVLLAEEVVELGEDGDVFVGGVGAVDVELQVAKVEIAVGQEEGVAAVAVVVQLEGGVVAAAADSAFNGGGKFFDGVLSGEEADVGWAAEGTAANERREGS